jgi:hypothetical protein
MLICHCISTTGNSPLLYGVYCQLYYEDLKRTGFTVVLNCAMVILMFEYNFLFAGVEAAPQFETNMVGIYLRAFLNIKTSILRLILLLYLV